MTFYNQLVLALNEVPLWVVVCFIFGCLFVVVFFVNWLLIPFKIGRIGNELYRLRVFLENIQSEYAKNEAEIALESSEEEKSNIPREEDANPSKRNTRSLR